MTPPPRMKRIIGMADMVVTNDTRLTLVTYALGSCLGISIHDPIAQVGGMLHVMLPESKIDPEKAQQNPFMFMDTGLPLLFTEAYKLGAQKERIVLKVAGGAHPSRLSQQDYFQIGKRNILMLRKILWKNGVLIQGSDLEGQNSRTMFLNVATGEVSVKSNGLLSIL